MIINHYCYLLLLLLFIIIIIIIIIIIVVYLLLLLLLLCYYYYCYYYEVSMLVDIKKFQSTIKMHHGLPCVLLILSIKMNIVNKK